MTSLSDLFPPHQLLEAVTHKYVRVQTHPDWPRLAIANYTEKAQYDKVWDDVTLNCRGLIYDTVTHEVHARPYRKFFNYGDDANTGPLDLDARVIVTDKLDGSLGIVYTLPDGRVAVATRGSFTSDQAIHATRLLREMAPEWRPLVGITYLVEIIYPQNRIVVDYGQRDDLVLHGGIDIDTGCVLHAGSLAWTWPGTVVDTFAHRSLAAALAAQPRPNAEGMVVRYVDNDRMIKIKQEDYVALHRIVTGLNARTVWEWLGDGKTVGDLCATIPDDFHGWIEDISTELANASRQLFDDGQTIHRGIVKHLDAAHAGWTRADYAHLANEARPEVRPFLYLLLDGNTDKADALAWRMVKPSGARSMVNHTEAVA